MQHSEEKISLSISLIIPIENQLKIFPWHHWWLTFSKNCNNELFSNCHLNCYIDLWSSLALSHTPLFNKLLGGYVFWEEAGFYVLAFCFGGFVLFCFFLFFLFFRWAHCWFFASMSWTTIRSPSPELTDVLFLWTYHGHSPSNWVQNLKTLLTHENFTLTG